MLTMPMKIKISVKRMHTLAGRTTYKSVEVYCHPGLDGNHHLIDVDRIVEVREQVDTFAASDWRVFVEEASTLRRWRPATALQQLVIAIADRIERNTSCSNPAAMVSLILDAASDLPLLRVGQQWELLITSPNERGVVAGYAHPITTTPLLITSEGANVA